MNIRNLRDIKGYKNAHGESLKENMIFRGGALDNISQAEGEKFRDEYEIGYVVDLRDDQEAQESPDIDISSIEHFHIPALANINDEDGAFDFGTMFKAEPSVDAVGAIHNYLVEGYRRMAFNNKAFHKIFDILLNEDKKLYYHCTAGKDRTGIATFLIMLALDFSEEEAIREYLLSNEYIDEFNKHLLANIKVDDEIKEAFRPILYVSREFIDETITAIKTRYDSYDEFLLAEYGIDSGKKKLLRSKYCVQ